MSAQETVTRVEIAEAIANVFGEGGATRDEIVATARSASRPEVVDVLTSLSARRFSRLNDLWEELHDVPVGA